MSASRWSIPAIHAIELIARDDDGHQRCDVRRNNMLDVTYRAIILRDDVGQGGAADLSLPMGYDSPQSIWRSRTMGAGTSLK